MVDYKTVDPEQAARVRRRTLPARGVCLPEHRRSPQINRRSPQITTDHRTLTRALTLTLTLALALT